MSSSGKQLKINELKRVVNVDQIKRYASTLEDVNNRNVSELNRILDELGKKTPSRDILIKTRLGHILKDFALRKGLPKSVREKAAALRTKWKEFHKRLLLAEKYDVKCDKPTTEHRARTRESIAKALRALKPTMNELDEQIIANLEFALFKHCDSLINANYFGTVRRVVNHIEQCPILVNDLFDCKLDAAEFINECLRLSGDDDEDVIYEATTTTTTSKNERDEEEEENYGNRGRKLEVRSLSLPSLPSNKSTSNNISSKQAKLAPVFYFTKAKK